ncbi:hypothetical protein KP509_06G000700 [Ceratopteris richardii]|uniref:Proline dehydrogenase n=1 Tax=Ceratopteris richardii TaxID=49495 RepID=A0A8T2UL90_CERRI|nr:hypothetical protein KP509_06G000700 [Ceratopteris richardii]
MAWQVFRLTCKRDIRYKFSIPRYSSIFSAYLSRYLSSIQENEHGPLKASAGDKITGKVCFSTLSYDLGQYSKFTNCLAIRSSRAREDLGACESSSLVQAYWDRASISKGWVRPRKAHAAVSSPITKSRVFSSLGRSTSHHLERAQDLPTLEHEGKETVEADILETQDGRILYLGMTSSELLYTLLNLQLVAYEPLVDLSIKLLKSPLMRFTVYRRPLLGILKKTAYSHFCAGEDVAEASGTLKRMSELGLKSILDYSLEDAIDNISCDNNLKGFLQTVHQAREMSKQLVSFSCVKITALCPLPLLERISSLLRWQHMHPDFKLLWQEDVLPIFTDESPMYHVKSPPDPLTNQEEQHLTLAKDRLWKLCRACDEAGLPLLIDAEYSSVQPAIDYYTYLAALEFNRNGFPLVYGTVQAYLKDSLPRLSLAAIEAGKRQINFGVKLVRGAYITRESALAASLGAESPVHSNIKKTHDCYDTCAAFMMQNAINGRGAVVLATHNIDSGRAAAFKAQTLGLSKGNPRLQFAQLKGMADTLSLALVHAGFQVSKYLPFGPVGHVLPYLIRRAEENRGLLGNSLTDRSCIRYLKMLYL